MKTVVRMLLCGFCLLVVVPVLAAERPQRVRPRAVADAPDQVPQTAQAVATAPSILSIVPAQAEPGARVTIFGSAFSDQISAYLGSVEIPARVTEGRQVEFVVPRLDAGLYALYLKRADGAVGRVYNFTVLPLRPVLESLGPDKVGACASGKDREVTASGQNFSEGAMVLFDGAVIPARVSAPSQIVFVVPEASGGMHQIQVKNDQENGSLPRAFLLETRPEISQVSIGTESVNYYELNIYGINFQQGSAIYVDGQKIGGKGGQEAVEREKLIYVDCTRLIYQRYPYSPVNKDFRIQVVNPGGESSQTVQVSAP